MHGRWARFDFEDVIQVTLRHFAEEEARAPGRGVERGRAPQVAKTIPRRNAVVPVPACEQKIGQMPF
jgi:hypothetical protein